VIIVAVGAWLPGHPWRARSAWSRCRRSFWLYLIFMLIGAAALTQAVKTWLLRRLGE